MLSLTLLGDRAMARLNRETFGRRGPTNVIAFPVDAAQPPTPPHDLTCRGTACRSPSAVATTDSPPPLLGEVVISIETTIRQAKESDWPWPELFDFFLIHGILHLLGYDHGTPAEEEAMTAKAWELMRLLHPKLKEL
jgi:probable rRNA maturation factor